jgi:hypothetical protein
MAFFDPVDPSTESLLWPSRVGFCFVAGGELSHRLPLWPFADREQKPPVAVAGYIEMARPS